MTFAASPFKKEPENMHAEHTMAYATAAVALLSFLFPKTTHAVEEWIDRQGSKVKVRKAMKWAGVAAVVCTGTALGTAHLFAESPNMQFLEMPTTVLLGVGLCALLLVLPSVVLFATVRLLSKRKPITFFSLVITLGLLVAGAVRGHGHQGVLRGNHHLPGTEPSLGARPIDSGAPGYWGLKPVLSLET